MLVRYILVDVQRECLTKRLGISRMAPQVYDQRKRELYGQDIPKEQIMRMPDDVFLVQSQNTGLNFSVTKVINEAGNYERFICTCYDFE